LHGLLVDEGLRDVTRTLVLAQPFDGHDHVDVERGAE
jgi:hypothetical protein